MKKVFSFIAVGILFIIAGLIFWAGLSPNTFYPFWNNSSVVKKTVSQVRVLGPASQNFFTATSSEPVKSSVGQIIIDKNAWNVEVSTSTLQKENGLSNRQVLYPRRGMLFVFDGSATRSFWMKDMLISLDMIFFDENWKIVAIEKSISPQTFPKTFGSNVRSKYVLEINAAESDSYGLAVGNQAIFLNK